MLLARSMIDASLTHFQPVRLTPVDGVPTQPSSSRQHNASISSPKNLSRPNLDKLVMKTSALVKRKLDRDYFTEPGDRSQAEGSKSMYCSARTKATGKPCKQKAIYANGRCKFHGGCSTGPRTEKGKQKSALNGFKKRFIDI